MLGEENGGGKSCSCTSFSSQCDMHVASKLVLAGHLLRAGVEWTSTQISATESVFFLLRLVLNASATEGKNVFTLTPSLDERLAFCLRSSAFINPAESAHRTGLKPTQDRKQQSSRAAVQFKKMTQTFPPNSDVPPRQAFAISTHM